MCNVQTFLNELLYDGSIYPPSEPVPNSAALACGYLKNSMSEDLLYLNSVWLIIM